MPRATSRCISSRGRCWRRKGEPLGVVTGIVGQSQASRHRDRRGRPRRHRADDAAPRCARRRRRDGAGAGSDRARASRATAWSAPSAASRRCRAPSTSFPARVLFTVDLRSLDRCAARRGHRAVQGRGVAHRDGARPDGLPSSRFHEIATAHCAPAMQDALAASVAELGHAPIRLPSGAGHDAQVMARLCPSAMLFVRCRGGISHNPAEFASPPTWGSRSRR